MEEEVEEEEEEVESVLSSFDSFAKRPPPKTTAFILDLNFSSNNQA